ncbi:hypothetical protein F2Q69_00004850 [Brassica cretica]|uniref:Uncharacterized protein n=1 Tax=Brassica cretica TaxID=69181 RepID=A0A8S9P0W4_BRACR|nr:hypothetical protein F2Q69_00004850 [Brassica cretica]
MTSWDSEGGVFQVEKEYSAGTSLLRRSDNKELIDKWIQHKELVGSTLIQKRKNDLLQILELDNLVGARFKLQRLMIGSHHLGQKISCLCDGDDGDDVDGRCEI